MKLVNSPLLKLICNFSDYSELPAFLVKDGGLNTGECWSQLTLCSKQLNITTGEVIFSE